MSYFVSADSPVSDHSVLVESEATVTAVRSTDLPFCHEGLRTVRYYTVSIAVRIS